MRNSTFYQGLALADYDYLFPIIIQRCGSKFEIFGGAPERFTFFTNLETSRSTSNTAYHVFDQIRHQVTLRLL